jgi:hypothetical protein
VATSFDTGTMGASGSLLPRFRRLFSFGDVLDESVRLFRAHWVEYAQISAVALLPPGLIVIGGSIAGLVGGARVLSELGTDSIDPTAISGLFAAAIGAIALIGVVAGLFSLLWTAAVVVTADAHMRGGRTGLAPVYRRALSR